MGFSSEHTGSVVVAHGLGCSEACGIFLEQGPTSPALAGGFLSTAGEKSSAWQESGDPASHSGSHV